MAIIRATVFLTATLLLAVGVDVHMNNKDFSESFTGRKLKEYGGFEYGLLAYEQAALASNRTAQWVVENVPIYVNATAEVLAPYTKLGRDLSLIAINVSKRVAYNVSVLISDNYPIAEYWVQQNLPIVRDSFLQGLTMIGKWTEVATDSAKIYGATAANYLRTNVFVGNLSPENLQKFTLEAYNSTQVLASNTMTWVYEKVQSLSSK